MTTTPEPESKDRETLIRLGDILPGMIRNMPWGAYKGALLEDGDIKRAIQLAQEANHNAD